MSVEESKIPIASQSLNAETRKSGDDEGDINQKMQELTIGKEAPKNEPEDYHTFDDAVKLLREKRKIVVVTGAGISVSCGIPDFRSKDGLYERLRQQGQESPESLFHISNFLKDPSIFYKYREVICPTRYVPSPVHFFLSKLEAEGKILRVYTQNIDGLDPRAGISRLIQCHGTFATASCMQCHHQVKIEEIEPKFIAKEVAYCEVCEQTQTEKKGVYKPDFVFFGENLPKVFNVSLEEELPKADCVLVIGSALAVYPVASIPQIVKYGVPQILINRDIVGRPGQFNIQLLGDCDDVVIELINALGWQKEIPLTLEQRRRASEEIDKLMKEENGKRDRDVEGQKKMRDFLIAMSQEQEEENKINIIQTFAEPNITRFKKETK
ncbi:MAG: putative NAD-dependent protein deacetylase sirtuin-1 [Streblomastix strix]|uniref:Putative NAD-dependent protein deacetylase sirtuin-1 n=1 Tax=Streblomastix strix TaxID=222440 RepID=A0A5J4WBZ3_9EUKA|nr:MAG: putative NAD-dependent protein deacetylase sirtuin-1 [Streblomastix strix]